jgi:hypothetical protein
MTDHITSLTPAAMRELIETLDQGLALFGLQNASLSASEVKIRQMILEVRNQVAAQLANRPDGQQ